MCDDDEKEFYTVLIHTCQACMPNAKPLTAEAMNMMFEDLRDYPLELVKKALQAHRRDKDRGQWLPSAAHIEHQIDIRRVVKWVSADEAWARMPKTPDAPALLNDVTVLALAAAQPFIEQTATVNGKLVLRPDMVAARMAFKGCYERLVERAKLERRVPVYFVSPGGSREEQQQVQDEAVRMGLLPPPAKLQQLEHDDGASAPSRPPPEFKALLLQMKGKTMPPPEAQDYER